MQQNKKKFGEEKRILRDEFRNSTRIPHRIDAKNPALHTNILDYKRLSVE